MNKIQFGDTLNPLDDYGGVPSVNDEGTLENLISKVDKVCGFMGTGKADGDLARYFPHILLAKYLEKLTYTDKKQLEFILHLTANTYANFSTMEICLPVRFTKKKNNKNLQMDGQMIT